MQIKVWYNRNVPANTKKTEQLAMKLLPETFAHLTEIAESEDRPVGYVARELMLRGLAQYQKDGRLREDAIARLAPVIAEITGGQGRKDVQRMIDAAPIIAASRKRKTR